MNTKFKVVTIVSLLIVLAAMLMMIPAAFAQGNSNVCPHGGEWSEHQSPPWNPVEGAVEYCFKAGNWDPIYSDSYPEAGFGNDGPCNQDISQCGLSHWSYRLGDVCDQDECEPPPPCEDDCEPPPCEEDCEPPSCDEVPDQDRCQEDKKIWICHVPAGNEDNYQVIHISVNAWENGSEGGHKEGAHGGDYEIETEEDRLNCRPDEEPEEFPICHYGDNGPGVIYVTEEEWFEEHAQHEGDFVITENNRDDCVPDEPPCEVNCGPPPPPPPPPSCPETYDMIDGECVPRDWTNCPTVNAIGLLYGVDYSLEGGGDVRVKEDGNLDFYGLFFNTYIPGETYDIYIAATGEVVGQVTVNDLGLLPWERCDLVVPEVEEPDCEECGPAVCGWQRGTYIGVGSEVWALNQDGEIVVYNNQLDAAADGYVYAGDECSRCISEVANAVTFDEDTVTALYIPSSSPWDTAIVIQRAITGVMPGYPLPEFMAIALDISAAYNANVDANGIPVPGFYTVDR